VVVGDLNFEGICAAPREADSPLIVDSDAVLPFATPFQLLQPVTRRHAKISKRNGSMQNQELPSRRSFNSAKARRGPIMKEPLGVWRPERPDHATGL